MLLPLLVVLLLVVLLLLLQWHALAAACHHLLPLPLMLLPPAPLPLAWALLGQQQLLQLLVGMGPLQLLCAHVLPLLLPGQQGSPPSWHRHCRRCLGPPSRRWGPPLWLLPPPLLLRLGESAGLRALGCCASSCTGSSRRSSRGSRRDDMLCSKQ